MTKPIDTCDCGWGPVCNCYLRELNKTVERTLADEDRRESTLIEIGAALFKDH